RSEEARWLRDALDTPTNAPRLEGCVTAPACPLPRRSTPRTSSSGIEPQARSVRAHPPNGRAHLSVRPEQREIPGFSRGTSVANSSCHDEHLLSRDLLRRL